ncbi:MAG: hypothetical protein E6X12_10655 [Actinomyces sp.]|jgi:hypothetical protein|nr:hypothetical protein [Cutibacterium avidum]MDU5006913.1 hypothetical protein [Actinomyces sp.]
MKKNKFIKTIALMLLAFVGISISQSVSVSAKTDQNLNICEQPKIKDKQKNTFSNEKYIKDIEPYVIRNSDGTLELSKKVPKSLYKKYNLSKLEERFNQLNKEVATGEITIQNDLSINRKLSETSPLLRVSSTSNGYGNHYGDFRREAWWGVQLGYCNKCTKDCVYDLRNYSNNMGLVGMIIIATYLPSWYMNKLANQMEYYNNPKGVYVDINNFLIFDVNPQ